MRPGSLVAAACLALLSCVRFAEQSHTMAVVFAVLALVALATGLRPQPAAEERPPPQPSADGVRDAARLHASHQRGWRAIALAGFAVSAVGVVVFPPMALVVAALSLYAVRRMHRSRESARLLGQVAG